MPSASLITVKSLLCDFWEKAAALSVGFLLCVVAVSVAVAHCAEVSIDFNVQRCYNLIIMNKFGAKT